MGLEKWMLQTAIAVRDCSELSVGEWGDGREDGRREDGRRGEGALR